MLIEQRQVSTAFTTEIDGVKVAVIVPHDWIEALARKAINSKGGKAVQSAHQTGATPIRAIAYRR